MFNDIDGYLVSREFLTQLAFFFTTIFSAIFGQLIDGWFNQP